MSEAKSSGDSMSERVIAALLEELRRLVDRRK